MEEFPFEELTKKGDIILVRNIGNHESFTNWLGMVGMPNFLKDEYVGELTSYFEGKGFIIKTQDDINLYNGGFSGPKIHFPLVDNKGYPINEKIKNYPKLKGLRIEVKNQTQRLPFNENINNGYHIRTFLEGVDDMDLVWHRDKEDRLVKSIKETDWMIQLDNELPKPLTETIFIPKNTYHRVIKGSGDLVVKIKKL